MGGTEVRPFVEGRDGGAWIGPFNSYYSRYYGTDMKPLDIEDVKWMERDPLVARYPDLHCRGRR